MCCVRASYGTEHDCSRVINLLSSTIWLNYAYITSILTYFGLLKQNRKAACGRQKEEILSQLREMTKSEPLDYEEYMPSRSLSTDFEHDTKTDIAPINEV